MHSNPVGNVPTLTAADAAALVTLRMLLEEAVQRSADGTPTGRRICIILLDGTCEASIALGLGQFNDAPGEKDSLQDIYSRLVGHLKAAGSLSPNGGIPGWPDIKRLRRVRNDAQHHQIPPDHATLVGWSASVQRFVESVINRALEVQLSLVVLADSICDPGLRQAFGSAEQLLIAGDYASTVRELQDVFRSAREKWDAEHRDATRLHRQSLPLRARSSSDVEKVVESKITLMDDLLSVAPFVLDIGEYVWWQSLANSLRTTSAVPVTAQDARRAAAFVLSWIQRWEAFSSTYTHDRLGIPKAAEVAESPIPGGDPILLPDQVDVSISRRASAREQTEDDLVQRIAIGYAAGRRDDPGGNIWIHFLTKAFTQRGAERPPPPWESVGVIPGTITLTAATDVEPATVISAVNEVLKAAVALKAQSKKDAEQRAALARRNADVLSDLVSAGASDNRRRSESLRQFQI